MSRSFTRFDWITVTIGLSLGAIHCGSTAAPSDAETAASVGSGGASVSVGATGSGGSGAAPDAGATDAAPDAAESPGPCPTEGGRSCGGNGIGGSPDTLYVCSGGQYVVDHVCGGACEALPKGIPDRCPGDAVAPASLVTALSPKPYVEESCKKTTWAGWPYDAQKCTYTSGGITTSVTVANPSADRVAAWIADASVFVPALWKLRETSPAQWEKGLIEFAKHTLGQSSRIFPLEGGIIENMGNGYVNYPFYKGVTQGCSSGCYCRINSLHRTEWCGFVELLGTKTYDACIADVGASGLTDAWGNECLGNHEKSWNANRNDHYRAMAWKVNQSVKASCPSSASCTPAEVVSAVHAALQ
jgi:hypothetical protein